MADKEERIAEVVDKLFQIYDKDNSGSLDVKELRLFLIKQSKQLEVD